MIREARTDEQYSTEIDYRLRLLFEPENPLPDQVLGVDEENFTKHIGANVMMSLKPYSATMLTVCSIILMGMGLYFAFVRPSLLPEDIRYIGLSSDQIQTAPSLLKWLDKVFWVMGGYVFTSGLLTYYRSQSGFTPIVVT